MENTNIPTYEFIYQSKNGRLIIQEKLILYCEFSLDNILAAFSVIVFFLVYNDRLKVRTYDLMYTI